MNKREAIALALWYERQPQARAAIWNTRHGGPEWLIRLFAHYISWKFMGGRAGWKKPLSAVAFWLTVALYAFRTRKL